MKKKQNGTIWKQTLTKSEIALLGLTALFLLFVFRGKGTSTKTVKVHALPKAQSEPETQSKAESDSVPETESDSVPAESDFMPETEPENIPETEPENIPAAETESVPAETQNSIADSGKMNLNTASAAELETLPGIGPALAGRIVEYRETNGPFHFPEELMDVSGIGEGKYQAVAGLVTTE